MDGPLFKYERYQNVDVEDADVDDDDDCMKRVKHALKQDNNDDFVQLINSMPCVELKYELFSISKYMCLWDSGNCAAAVLAGETKISDVTALLAADGSSPLHTVALYGASRITTLLLESGFSADARSDCESLNLRDVLPLGVVLSKLRSDLWRRNLKGRTSAVKLIIELFGVSKQPLETLRLFAQNSREVKCEFLNYLKEGKMVEVGALLLVAKSRLLSSSTAKGEYVFGFRSISEMHDFLLEEMSSYIYAKRSSYTGASLTELHCKNKLIEMEETLLLLKIFDRIGDKLAVLLRLDIRQTGMTVCSTLAAASLIEDAGFDVKAEHLYRDRPYTRTVRFRSNVLESGVDDCKNTAFTTFALPSLLKEAALSGLAAKSVSTSRLVLFYRKLYQK